MNAQIVVVIIVIVEIFFIICAFFTRKKKETFNWLVLLVGTIATLSALVTVVFPEEVATAIYPDIDKYESENQLLIEENNNLKVDIAAIQNDYENLEKDYFTLDGLYNALKQEYEDYTLADIIDAKLVINGLEIAEMRKCIALVDGEVYFSSNVLSSITGESLRYNSEQSTIFYGAQNEVTKIPFSDVSDILYNGQVYWKYTSAGTDSFTVAGKEYADGFVIGCDHSLFGEGDGYVLFNLQGDYTKLEFDVGKTDNYEIQDVTVKIFLDGAMTEQYELSGETTSEHIEVNLNNASDLKILITGGSRVTYGFFNVVFTT